MYSITNALTLLPMPWQPCHCQRPSASESCGHNLVNRKGEGRGGEEGGGNNNTCCLLSTSHKQNVTIIITSLSLHHYHYIITSLSLHHYHYIIIITLLQDCRKWVDAINLVFFHTTIRHIFCKGTSCRDQISSSI